MATQQSAGTLCGQRTTIYKFVMLKQNPAATSRRALLKAIFIGTAATAIPGLNITRARAANAAASALPLPVGPLAQIPEVEKKTLTAGAIPGVDDEVFAPPGFDVRVVARKGLNPVSGQPDPDGYEWHKDPDGGAVFPSPEDGGWVYVSNSEETPGGVGALRFDAEGNLIDAYSILEGSRNNCAGGPTPWGTWLSCEETGGGYVWECDPFGTPADAVRKTALGALNHEAAAIDPINHVCYETEDGGTQRFYRFVSNPDDLSETPDGTVRMGLESGTLQVMNIQGFEDGQYPEDAAAVREPTPVSWTTPPTCAIPATVPLADFPDDVCDAVNLIEDGVDEFLGVDTGALPLPRNSANGTYFASAEGLWYYEIPEALRETPINGTVPTRGVIFFTTKGDNRVWAYDIENELIEIIYDNENMQMETGFNQVDNLVVSPAGDILVAEDGALMRLVVVVPNGQARLLMQITKGGSEITGPAFTPDGSRLYFSSQRGPSEADGSGTDGATFEMTIPPEYRSLFAQQQSANSPNRDTNGDAAPGTQSGSGALGVGLGGIALAAAASRAIRKPDAPEDAS